MVALSFLAAAIATWLFQHVAVQAITRRRPQDVAWATALGLFSAACVTLAIGNGTTWDLPTFRIFYLTGAILNVPWLGLGSLALFLRPNVYLRIRNGLLFFSGLATGIVLIAPTKGALAETGIPSGKELFGAAPRILAAVGSGVGAVVILVCAIASAWALRSTNTAAARRRMYANILIALGTLVLAAGGTLQGILGKDLAFVTCTASGIALIALGVRTASRSSNRQANDAATNGLISTDAGMTPSGSTEATRNGATAPGANDEALSH